MELINTHEDDEELVLERTTDSVKMKSERYVFKKPDKESLKLVKYQNDRGDSIYPPEIDESIRNEIEERSDKEIVEAPIYSGSCPTCNQPIQQEVEVEENERGYEKPVNDEMEVECPICREEKTVKILKNGHSIASRV